MVNHRPWSKKTVGCNAIDILFHGEPAAQIISDTNSLEDRHYELGAFIVAACNDREVKLHAKSKAQIK